MCRANASLRDPLVQYLPRYQTCKTDAIRNVYEFPVFTTRRTLAYYSSHGDIQSHKRAMFEKTVIVVHGANNNADDYYCSMSTILEQDSLLIGVWFPTQLQHVPSPLTLTWNATDPNGNWRYGANALHTDISSFSALDALVEYVNAVSNHVSLVGHSSGGQLVQRYALLTNYWTQNTRGIVMNPSSYAYLTPLRYDTDAHEWTEPRGCSVYNQWPYGLDDNKEVPYYTSVLRKLGPRGIINRFPDRNVVYLVGSQDRCNVSVAGWCDSHGLETTCADTSQGGTRLLRWQFYLQSLQSMVQLSPPSYALVPGIGHDHALMFQSGVGRAVILGRLQLVASLKQAVF